MSATRAAHRKGRRGRAAARQEKGDKRWRKRQQADEQKKRDRFR